MCSCSGKVNKMTRVKSNDELSGESGYVEVVFTTNSTVNRVASSPTRKVSNYGSYPHGATIYVHEDDQKRVPHLYVLVEKPPAPKRKRQVSKGAK